MNESFAVFSEVLNAAFQLSVIRFALCLLPFALLGPLFRMMFDLMDCKPDFSCIFVEIWKWLFDKVITWLCSTEKGFFLAYKLGWARPGVDFFECGIDCAACPKKDTCPSAASEDDASDA